MAVIQPKGEKLRQAVRWISEQRQQGPEQDMAGLIEQASVRFNLSPKEESFLNDFFGGGEASKG